MVLIEHKQDMKKLKIFSKKSHTTKPTGRQVLQQIGARKNSPPNTTKKGKFRLWWSRRRRWQKALLILITALVVFLAQAYAIAFWYQQKHKNEPLTYGVTFIGSYANYFELDPQDTFLALRDDLGFRRFRFVSYWEEIEKSPGVYDFSELDWLFDKVTEVNGEVTLSVGLRQPRWPECHAPSWIHGKSTEEWYPDLEKIMTAVINRYKDRPVLQSYQLENEYFLGVFGNCKEFPATRERLVNEFNLLKSLDSTHPVIISLSNNYLGLPIGQPRPDQFGISVYKRVWDKTITKRYFEYPFPSWYYAWRAGMTEIVTGKSSMIHELQAEPWPPGDLKTSSIEEQNKSMDATRLKERFKYGREIGMKDIDLWGGEWWYWRKIKFGDNSLWEVARSEMINAGQLQP
jgi:hypothetical protein